MNPHVAITALLHRLVTDCFLPHSTKGCLEAQVREAGSADTTRGLQERNALLTRALENAAVRYGIVGSSPALPNRLLNVAVSRRIGVIIEWRVTMYRSVPSGWNTGASACIAR